MTQEKLKQIIERENEGLEAQAVHQATRIISAISERKRGIAEAEKEIKELQAELKKIEITRIDPISILGE